MSISANFSYIYVKLKSTYRMTQIKMVLVVLLNLWCVAAKLKDDWNNEKVKLNLNWDYWNTLIPKLNKVFEDTEITARVLFYLQEEQEQQDNDNYGPALKILIQVINDEELFTAYARNLAEDTKKAKSDERFKNYLSLVYSKMLDATKGNNNEENNIGYDNKQKAAGFHGMIHTLAMMSGKNQLKMLKMIKKLVPNTLYATTNGLVKYIHPAGGNHLISAHLVTAQLSYEALMNIIRWWNGEISGKRVAKNILESSIEIGGYTAGAYAGGTLGAAFGPIGVVVGGIMGSFLGGKASSELIDHLTLHVFDLPKSEALENAYNFFEVSRHATNHEINKAYRKKSLQYHPDKRGSEEKFINVQVQMSIIKAARKDY